MKFEYITKLPYSIKRYTAIRARYIHCQRKEIYNIEKNISKSRSYRDALFDSAVHLFQYLLFYRRFHFSFVC